MTESVRPPRSATNSRVPSLEAAGKPGPAPTRTRVARRPVVRSATAATARPPAEPAIAVRPLGVIASPPPMPGPSGIARSARPVARLTRSSRPPSRVRWRANADPPGAKATAETFVMRRAARHAERRQVDDCDPPGVERRDGARAVGGDGDRAGRRAAEGDGGDDRGKGGGREHVDRAAAAREQARAVGRRRERGDAGPDGREAGGAQVGDVDGGDAPAGADVRERAVGRGRDRDGGPAEAERRADAAGALVHGHEPRGAARDEHGARGRARRQGEQERQGAAEGAELEAGGKRHCTLSEPSERAKLRWMAPLRVGCAEGQLVREPAAGRRADPGVDRLGAGVVERGLPREDLAAVRARAVRARLDERGRRARCRARRGGRTGRSSPRCARRRASATSRRSSRSRSARPPASRARSCTPSRSGSAISARHSASSCASGGATS